MPPIQQCYSLVRNYLPDLDEEEEEFRFLDLPLEIRIMIYEYIFDFGAVDKYFKRYFEEKCLKGDHATASYFRKKCPSILLASKEIFNEAKPVLNSTPLCLSYGALGLRITDIISPDLLRNLQHITVSDVGSRHVDPPPASAFTGYCFAVVQIAGQLRVGHRLKTFTVSFKSPYVTKHLEKCLPDPGRICGIKSWAHNLRRYMKEMQGLKRVIVDVDLPEDIMKDITDKMLAKPTGLMALPFRVRRKIWSYAVDINDGIIAMRLASEELHRSATLPEIVKTTPSVLLVNKQISSEASSAMHARPLIISGLAPHVGEGLALDTFISLPVLCRIRSLTINITDWRHLSNIVGSIKEALKEGHKLQRFRLHFSEPDARQRILADGRSYPDNPVIEALLPLNCLRLIEDVQITGTLPKCFTRPLEYNMSEVKPGGRTCMLQTETARGGESDVGPGSRSQNPVLVFDEW